MVETPKAMTKIIFHVESKHIDYIRNTLESYDGMALVRTIDPSKALIEIHIAPKCEYMIFELIEYITNKEGIEIREYEK